MWAPLSPVLPLSWHGPQDRGRETPSKHSVPGQLFFGFVRMMGWGARQGEVSQHSCGSLGAREVVGAGIVGRVVTPRIFPRSNHESHQARDGEQRGC